MLRNLDSLTYFDTGRATNSRRPRQAFRVGILMKELSFDSDSSLLGAEVTSFEMPKSASFMDKALVNKKLAGSSRE